MDVNRQDNTPWLLLHVIIRHVHGCKQTGQYAMASITCDH